ncbi:flotillin family protein [Breznakia pachnodae]|uniref:Flotillin n=1 Tax=Breznakia pachnodae TaxID=265178 RepID=A0ABU0DXW9_9FIRM|nr:flotillin family protein [Breznakia pachnodae]MDQ0359485.1 flotillin [Breznakia pachnodae]
MDYILENWSIFLAILVGLFVLIIIVSGYVKAPPDKVYIISGLRKNAKYVIGRASIKIPFLERKDELELSLVQVDIKTETAVPTKEFINVRVDGVANVKVSSDPESVSRAAENFLNKDKNYISAIAQQVLEGNMREIIGQMELTELVHNRDVFAQNVQESTTKELSNMGLSVINLTIQNFIDDNNVIENLGIDNVTKIQKEAAIARANSERDIKIAQSQANSQANDADVTSQTQIAITQNELAIKRATLKSQADTEQAKSDASYSIAQQISRKQIEVETVNAEIAKTEREAEQKQKEIEVRENALRAEVEKVADADRYREQQKAEAELFKRKKEAEALAFEIEREAEAEQKRAEAIRQVGLAEAEIIERKAEALNRYTQSALSQMLIEKLPEIVKGAAEPLSKTEKIIMFGDGNAEKMVGDTLKSSLGVVEGLKEGTGIDLAAILNGFAGTKMALDASKAEDEVIKPEVVEKEESDKPAKETKKKKTDKQQVIENIAAVVEEKVIPEVKERIEDLTKDKEKTSDDTKDSEDKKDNGLDEIVFKV